MEERHRLVLMALSAPPLLLPPTAPSFGREPEFSRPVPKWMRRSPASKQRSHAEIETIYLNAWNVVFTCASAMSSALLFMGYALQGPIADAVWIPLSRTSSGDAFPVRCLPLLLSMCTFACRFAQVIFDEAYSARVGRNAPTSRHVELLAFHPCTIGLLFAMLSEGTSWVAAVLVACNQALANGTALWSERVRATRWRRCCASACVALNVAAFARAAEVDGVRAALVLLAVGAPALPHSPSPMRREISYAKRCSALMVGIAYHMAKDTNQRHLILRLAGSRAFATRG